MVFGFDLSHWNKNIDISGINAGFCFLKASEGAKGRDNMMNEYIKILSANIPLTKMPFIGFYHYARPEINTPAVEACNFLNAVQPHIGNCMLALDWEGIALDVKGGEDWAIRFLDMIGNETGTSPIFYIQASSLSKYPNIAVEFPLWVACYSQDSRQTKYRQECEKADFLQITSHPFDIDIFKHSTVELARIIKGDFDHYRKGV